MVLYFLSSASLNNVFNSMASDLWQTVSTSLLCCPLKSKIIVFLGCFLVTWRIARFFDPACYVPLWIWLPVLDWFPVNRTHFGLDSAFSEICVLHFGSSLCSVLTHLPSGTKSSIDSGSHCNVMIILWASTYKIIFEAFVLHLIYKCWGWIDSFCFVDCWLINTFI